MGPFLLLLVIFPSTSSLCDKEGFLTFAIDGIDLLWKKDLHIIESYRGQYIKDAFKIISVPKETRRLKQLNLKMYHDKLPTNTKTEAVGVPHKDKIDAESFVTYWNLLSPEIECFGLKTLPTMMEIFALGEKDKYKRGDWESKKKIIWETVEMMKGQ